MMYKLDLTPLSPLASPPITGATLSPAESVEFVPWQPSAWPVAPTDDHHFVMVLKRIFELSMLLEIDNVIKDSTACTGSLMNRGHVIAIAQLCALDAISSYGYGRKNGKQIPQFVVAHFPESYRPHANKILSAYRHALIHSWNLFTVAIMPGEEPITSEGKILSFGLINFFEALKDGTESFLEQLRCSPTLMANARERYAELRKSAKRRR